MQMGKQTHCRHALGTSFSACAGVSSADGRWWNSACCTCCPADASLFLSGPSWSSGFLLLLCRAETKALCQQQHRTPKKATVVLRREWNQQGDKGRNCADMEAFLFFFYTYSWIFLLCFSSVVLSIPCLHVVQCLSYSNQSLNFWA